MRTFTPRPLVSRKFSVSTTPVSSGIDIELCGTPMVSITLARSIPIVTSANLSGATGCGASSGRAGVAGSTETTCIDGLRTRVEEYAYDCGRPGVRADDCDDAID